MSKFAVIYVNQCYDYVENVTSLGTYPTEELALEFIKNKNEAYQSSFLAKSDYINKFVDEKVGIPETKGYYEWLDAIKPFPMFPAHTNHDNFKENLKRSLLQGHPLKNYPEYNPPELVQSGSGMWVVEIK